MPPSRVAVLTGRRHRLSDGTEAAYRLVRAGRVLRVPVIESLHLMDVTTWSVPIQVRDCLSKGGLPLDVEASATVKLAAELPLAAGAVERFLDCDRGQVAEVVTLVLAGSLRREVAEVSADDARARPHELAEAASREAADELRKLGLLLEVLQVTKVTSSLEH